MPLHCSTDSLVIGLCEQFPSTEIGSGLEAAFNHKGLGIEDVDAVTTPWDVTKLRRTFLRLIARRFPFSLNLLHQRSHAPQRNQIVYLNRYLAKAVALARSAVFSGRGLSDVSTISFEPSNGALVSSISGPDLSELPFESDNERCFDSNALRTLSTGGNAVVSPGNTAPRLSFAGRP